jgi:hypothetical protein
MEPTRYSPVLSPQHYGAYFASSSGAGTRSVGVGDLSQAHPSLGAIFSEAITRPVHAHAVHFTAGAPLHVGPAITKGLPSAVCLLSLLA